MTTHQPLRIAVLISGAGSMLRHFISLRDQGTLSINLVRVISSREQAPGVQHARDADIPTTVVPHHSELFSKHITAAVEQSAADLVCMAGFLSMWIIPPDYEYRVMNIHPALLPGFGGKGYYGLKVHQAVLQAGCKVSGCTVHFADNQYDHGPIILQKAVPVQDADTPEQLARRVARAERLIYPEAVRLFAAGRLQIDGKRVRAVHPDGTTAGSPQAD